jgi:hypothetical protein
VPKCPSNWKYNTTSLLVEPNIDQHRYIMMQAKTAGQNVHPLAPTLFPLPERFFNAGCLSLFFPFPFLSFQKGRTNLIFIVVITTYLEERELR